MTFQPVLPFSGYSGWLFLERTADSQRDTFSDSPAIKRNTDTFREKIGSIQTAEELVKDRELLTVALGAYGLDEDIDNKFFIQKILESSPLDDRALANRLADSRYSDLNAAFGFGNIGPARTTLSFFADEIIERYEARQFERAVGEQDNDMRLALNLAPALDDVISANRSNNAQWFAMMGNSPLRSMVQTALGLPSSVASIDIDKQLEQFKDRAQSTFGTDRFSELNSAENQEKMIRLYLLRSQAQASASFGGASIALSLLQQV